MYVARFGSLWFNKLCNVNSPQTAPYRTEPAHSIQTTWHGTAQFFEIETAPQIIIFKIMKIV